MSSSRVLVVLPTLGQRLSHLETALASCDKLAQVMEITLCVVAPAEATEAREMASSHGALLINDPGTGMADAVNAALASRTSEEFYIWLGDDDRIVAEGTTRLVAALDAHPEASAAYGWCDYVNDDGVVISRNRAGIMATWLLAWGPNLIPHPGTVIRLDAIERAGGFNPALLYALDLDMFLRLRKFGPLLALKTVASEFRWHEDSLTVESRARSSAEAMAVKASHLPSGLRFLAPLWQWPVAWASALAAREVERRSVRGRAVR